VYAIVLSRCLQSVDCFLYAVDEHPSERNVGNEWESDIIAEGFIVTASYSDPLPVSVCIIIYIYIYIYIVCVYMYNF